MDKEKVIKKVIAVFTKKLAEMKSSLASANKRANDAPGHNVSHSDTTKFQLSNLALGFEKQVADYEWVLQHLQSLTTEPCEIIGTGCLFTLLDIDADEERTFLLLYKGGGEKIAIDGVEIMTLTAEAPLPKACLGKEEGEEIKFNKKSFEIIEVL